LFPPRISLLVRIPVFCWSLTPCQISTHETASPLPLGVWGGGVRGQWPIACWGNVTHFVRVAGRKLGWIETGSVIQWWGGKVERHHRLWDAALELQFLICTAMM
jgi:hypothetical protein